MGEGVCGLSVPGHLMCEMGINHNWYLSQRVLAKIKMSEYVKELKSELGKFYGFGDC